MQQAEMAGSTCRRCDAPGKCETASPAPILAMIGDTLRAEEANVSELYNVGSMLRTAALAMEALSTCFNIEHDAGIAIIDIQHLIEVAAQRVDAAAADVDMLNDRAQHSIAQLQVAA